MLPGPIYFHQVTLTLVLPLHLAWRLVHTVLVPGFLHSLNQSIAANHSMQSLTNVNSQFLEDHAKDVLTYGILSHFLIHTYTHTYAQGYI